MTPASLVCSAKRPSVGNKHLVLGKRLANLGMVIILLINSVMILIINPCIETVDANNSISY